MSESHRSPAYPEGTRQRASCVACALTYVATALPRPCGALRSDGLGNAAP